MMARASAGKYGGALTTTMASMSTPGAPPPRIAAGSIVAMWSSTMPPPLGPIAFTRGICR